ncbi:COP9 signalosome (CSN) subunit [Umbelopsis nana]
MRTSIPLYLETVAGSASNCRGKQLASLLSLSDPHVNTLLEHNAQPSGLVEVARSKLSFPWDDILLLHLGIVHDRDQANYQQAYEDQKELVQLFQRAINNYDKWCLPFLYEINKDLRDLAIQADLQQADEKKENRNLEEAANVISKSFTYCITDRSLDKTNSRKWGTYHISNLLFKTYFKLKSQNLCRNVLKAVKASDLPPLDSYPKADRVVYRYYLGRLYFLEEQYVKADQELSLAFRECSTRYARNKQLILHYLLPTKIYLGKLPTQKLLGRYPSISSLYSPLVNAIRQGNVRAFDLAMESGYTQLINRGTFLTIEKARSMVIRTLCRRVYAIVNSTRISMDTFKQALEFAGLEVDMEEVECMLAVLIYKGYIKGYLSHEKQFVVLSAKDPFPMPSSIVPS